MTTWDMDKELQNYAELDMLGGINWPRPVYSGEVVKTSLSGNGVIYLMADLARLLDNYRDARNVLEEAVEGAGSEAELSSLGAIVHYQLRQEQRAAEQADRALALAPDNPVVLSNIARYEWNVHFAEKDNKEATTEMLDKAELHARMAIELDAGSPVAYKILGNVMQEMNQDNEALRNYITASNLTPSDQMTQLQIIKILLKNERPDLASPFITNLRSTTHSSLVYSMLDTLSQQIEKGEIDITPLEKFRP